MRKLKRMAINMFGLFLGIVFRKFSWIFDFGSQISKWVACSMNPVFRNTCIFRWSEIRHFSIVFRSSHQRCSKKKGVLKSSAKFTGKHLKQSLFLNKFEGLSSATFLKKRLWHRSFPVNFTKSLRTRFLQNSSGRLLLYFLFCYCSLWLHTKTSTTDWEQLPQSYYKLRRS